MKQCARCGRHLIFRTLNANRICQRCQAWDDGLDILGQAIDRYKAQLDGQSLPNDHGVKSFGEIYNEVSASRTTSARQER